MPCKIIFFFFSSEVNLNVVNVCIKAGSVCGCGWLQAPAPPNPPRSPSRKGAGQEGDRAKEQELNSSEYFPIFLRERRMPSCLEVPQRCMTGCIISFDDAI